MSTKIYGGKIIKAEHLGKFHDWFYKYCVKEIYKLAVASHSYCSEEKINAHVEEKLAEIEKRYGHDFAEKLRKANHFKYDFAFLHLVSGAAIGLVHLNPSCGYNVYPSGSDILLIPYVPGSNYHSDRIRFPKYVKDYCYFNNSDKPAKISEEEWNAREERWNKVLDKRQSKIGCDIFRFFNTSMYENLGMSDTLEAALHMFPDYDKNHRMMGNSVARAYDLVFKAIEKDRIEKYEKDKEVNEMLERN